MGHGEAGAGALDPRHRRVRNHHHARGQRPLEQPAVVERRVQDRVAGDHPAAVIDVAADLAVLLGPRHGVAVEADLAAQGLEIARQRLVVARPVGADETARAREAARDALAFDHLGEVLERGPRLAVHGQGARLAVARAQPVEARLEPAAALAAVARAAAVARRLGVEDDHAAALARQGERRRQPGVARTDHGDVGRARRIGRAERRRGRIVEPEGLELVARGEQRMGHLVSISGLDFLAPPSRA